MGGNATQNLIPTERRSMRIAVTAASPNTVSTDLANAGVVLFSGAPAVTQGTVYPLSILNQAPVALSGTWINVTSSAITGTLFKFLRRGQYRAQLSVMGTTNSALAWQIGITLDCAAAQCVIATSALVPTSQGLIDYTNYVGAAVAIGVPLKVAGVVQITDAQAASAAANLPTAVAGTFSGGTGVLRFHSTTGAGAAATTQGVVADTRAEIDYQGDLAG